jgi:nicotinamidase-related amidase
MNRHYPEAYMDVAHTALLLIDIQNDFCHTNGVAGLNGKSMAMMDGMLSHASRLLQAARKAGVLVVHVQHTVLPFGGSDAPAWRYFLSPLSPDGAIVVHGTWGHGFMDAVKPLPGENILTKHRSSAFFNTQLDTLLRARQVRTIAICGVLAEGCVESTLRDSFHRDYYPVLVPDATASYSEEIHSAYVMVASARHDAMATDDLIAVWGQQVEPQVADLRVA